MSEAKNEQQLYYFGYASNLSIERMELSISNVDFKCSAILKDYQLVFSGSDCERWRGPYANLVFSKGSHVYGAVYKITKKDLEDLDEEEGVNVGIYERLWVDVEPLAGDKTTLKCALFVKVDKNEKTAKPSIPYKNLIINGALSINLPDEYIAFLKSFQDNGYNGEVGVNLPKKYFTLSN